MDQEPSSSGRGGKPGIFQKLNTTIAGITGLVIALGGLTAATKGVLWDKEPSEKQAVAAAPAEQPAAAEQATEEAEAEAPTTLYKGDLYDDGKFNGGSLSLEKKGTKWVLDDGDKQYEYDELASDDKSQILAVSSSYTSALRWPAAGGIVEESQDERRDKWETYGKVEAAN